MVEPEDLCGNLLVQLGLATEDLNRRWYEANTGQALTDVQRQIRHPALRWVAATLDGRVEATGAVLTGLLTLMAATGATSLALISINASDAPTQPVDRALVTTHLQHLEGELALP
jgi:hypothetical protein